MGNNKAIVITGTSSGIGRECALYLDKAGFTVYAGVRKSGDANSLKNEASENLIPIILDVCDVESIHSAHGIIEKETGGEIFGLINNAGIGCSSILEVTPIADIRKIMEVNVIGLMAVTQAFIPMLRRGKGRIINIGSASSMIALPGASVYSASKFAVRAITDSLRLELKSFGISVILVAPGAVVSEIWDKGRAYKKKLYKSVKPETAQLYSKLIKFGDNLNEKSKKIPTREVAKVMVRALTSTKPKYHYPIGRDAKRASRAVKFPKSILDWMIMRRVQKLGL
jgi:short-subunit dehydrogenase